MNTLPKEIISEELFNQFFIKNDLKSIWNLMNTDKSLYDIGFDFLSKKMDIDQEYYVPLTKKALEKSNYLCIQDRFFSLRYSCTMTNNVYCKYNFSFVCGTDQYFYDNVTNKWQWHDLIIKNIYEFVATNMVKEFLDDEDHDEAMIGRFIMNHHKESDVFLEYKMREARDSLKENCDPILDFVQEVSKIVEQHFKLYKLLNDNLE
jgi:hypothetical protein